MAVGAARRPYLRATPRGLAVEGATRIAGQGERKKHVRLPINSRTRYPDRTVWCGKY